VGNYEADKKRLTIRMAVFSNVSAVVFIVLFLTHIVNVMTLMLLLLLVLLVIIGWFFVQMAALNKRHGKY